MKKFLKSLALALALAPSLSNALDYKIFAIVNGESITTQEVRDRVQLVISSSALDDSAKNKKEVTKEVGEILINEKLQAQEAKEKNIVLKDEEIKAVLTDLEKRNNLKPGGFKKYIEAKGLSYETLVDQIRASLLWRKILGAYVQPKVEITEADIKKAEIEKPKSAGKNKVDISEIIIPIEFGSEDESKDLADTIVRTARTGAKDFGELAAKYSGGKTAAQKGHLGWMLEDGIKEPMASLVRKTKAGDIAEPMKIESLYVILKVNAREPLIPVDKSTPRERAFAARMEEGAKRYIKNLRDAGYIEKKFTDENEYSFVWN
jgi:peptidyl-prolyl cis-trans isomerase SurA